MPKYVERHRTAQKLERSADLDARLVADLSSIIEQGFADRFPQDLEWRNARRQYAAIPRQPYRNTPIPDAPNIEVPLGAIASDAIYGQVIATIYSGDPLLSVRALDQLYIDHAKAMQRWVNYVVEHEVGLRNATDDAWLDVIQLGTAAYYIPHVEHVRLGKVYKTTHTGPRIIPIAPENILFPGGSRGDVQHENWVALRWWYSKTDLMLRGAKSGWDIEKAMPVAHVDYVRQATEHYGKTSSSANFTWFEHYEVLEVYICYDYHNDGQFIELLVYFDRSAQHLLHVQVQPYDLRPIEPMVYQKRAHLAYGLGVMEMMRTFEDEASDIHSHRTLNMLLANARMWAVTDGSVADTMKVWPNRFIPVRDKDGIKELRLADIYPSAQQAEQSVTALAERRVGTDGLMGASRQGPIGTRTPGITAMSVMKEQDDRFTAPFDNMRLATSRAVVQALWRQREVLLSGNAQLEAHIESVLGEDAPLVIELLKSPKFEHSVQVEFTAAKPTVNREADRQNAVLMWNTMMTGYYRPVMELLTTISVPGTPPMLIEVSKQIIEKAGELADRFLRTFDQMRDPQRFTVSASGEIEEHQLQMEQQTAMQGMTSIISALLGGGAPGAEGGDPNAPGQDQQALPPSDGALPPG